MVLPLTSSVMDAIVIGCGASGVAALTTLHAAGLKVLALEASDRIGGRINTVPFGDNVVDIGAQWCHGEEDNAVYTLAKDLEVLGRPTLSEQVYLLSDGRRIDDGQDAVETFNNILDNADKNNRVGLKDYLREKVKTTPISNKESTNSLLEWFERTKHVGGQRNPGQTKSLRGLEEAWPCGGEFLLNWKNRGYKTLLDILLKRYPDPSLALPVQILLNKEVETIKWKGSGDESANPLVQIVCKDGSMYAAKAVVVTMSVDVLKRRHDQMFRPPLPKEKVDAINGLSMAVIDKIYVKFDKKWWPDELFSFNLLWRDEDKKNLDYWLTEVYWATAVEHQNDVLCFWIYGDGAKEMEKVGLDAVKSGVEKILETFFGEYPVTGIVDIIRSQWATDPFTGGAYSYRSVESEHLSTGAVALSTPLLSGGLPTLCFGGEASSWHRHGDVNGAVEAGEREAERIIDAFAK